LKSIIIKIVFLPRPFFYTDKSWPEFQPYHSVKSWTFDASWVINNFTVGVSYESYKLKSQDDIFYKALIGFDENDNPLYFNSEETYYFDSKFTPILAHVNYRFFSDMLVYPEIGFGVGLGISKFKWKWHYYGSKLINGIRYYFKGDKIWIDKEEKKIVFQPRFRLNLNLSKFSERISKYFDSIFFQMNYIFCNSNYDIFKNFREEVLSGYSKDELTEPVKKLYNKYQVKWGGFQIKFGISIKRFN